MKKYIAAVRKEALLLMRDFEGIILIFLMPLILVVVMALLQHRTFQNIAEVKIPLVVVNLDNDSVGSSFVKGINDCGIFDVKVLSGDDSTLTAKAKEEVAKGRFQIGIVIPENTTKRMKKRAMSMIQKQLPSSFKSSDSTAMQQTSIQLFFDPMTKDSFKALVQATLDKFAAQTETRIVFTGYSKVIDAMTNQHTEIDLPTQSGLVFQEQQVSEFTGGIMPNAVQHNVPAWTLFGMFLICIPVASSIINERNDGCLARLKTIPVSYLNIMSGKNTVFVTICMIQAVVICWVGVYFMPMMGLPALQINNNYAALFFMALASAFAATGFGIAIGSIAKTNIQASTFGSVSTVILAAVGGVWIPVMVMPEMMRTLSAFSPMNWGVTGFYAIFLRNASLLEVLPQIIKLFSFFGICLGISIVLRRYKAEK